MTDQRIPLKTCPVCSLAMVAEKSNEDAPRPDTFSCLHCGCVISIAPSDPDAGDD